MIKIGSGERMAILLKMVKGDLRLIRGDEIYS